MTDLSPASLERDGALFIPKVVSDSRFARQGVLWGSASDCLWAVLNPRAHPLFVWRKAGSAPPAYGRSSRSLDATIFTNGPMMGKRSGLTGKQTRVSAAAELAVWPLLGAAGGLLVCRASQRHHLTALLGTIGGAALGTTRVFTGWIPCGIVSGRHDMVDDRRDFDREGQRHAWIGRFADDFNSYRIGQGDLPLSVREGLGGLILLLQDFSLPSTRPGDPSFSPDFLELAHKRGVVAWGLVPLVGNRLLDKSFSDYASVPAEPRLEGVLIVAGSACLDAESMAARLRSIGVRDAVATDQRASIMVGSRAHFMIGPPPLHRQLMQLYGLACR